MTPLFQRAQRTQARLRLAIDGPSGSGKTYSALLIAKGLAGGDLSKVALIDTERGSGSLYADLGPYAVLDFEPPYTVKRFVQAHDAAVAEGFAVIVIDSLTHFWSGEGGILDAVDKIAATSSSGNTFAAWKKGTPLQKELFDTMLASPCHVIGTMRSKTEYVIEENERGKKAPRKVGLAPEQRKDAEYEFTLVLDLSREHIAQASKDRTGLWDERLEVPTEKHGEELAAWLGSAAPAPPPRRVLRDEQAETPQPAPGGNGHITKTQARRLHEELIAKGRDTHWFLERLATRSIGDGEHLTSIPDDQYEEILKIVRSFADPAPKAPESAREPEPAPAAAETAPAPTEAETDEEPPGMDAEAYKARLAGEAAAPARKPTVTAAQLTRLGAICADLEAGGVGEEEWRTYLFAEEGVRSRTHLTKTAATRMIDKLARWATDVASGVATPGKTAA
jgi:hypothetical protein